MRVLIADDDALSRCLLTHQLAQWNYDVLTAEQGLQAWEYLTSSTPPELAILDWMMPDIEGVELCRRLRRLESPLSPYLILLTSRNTKEDIVEGLEAGADDFLVKPCASEELRARIEIGKRMILLQQKLLDRVTQLEIALSRVQRLEGLLPICCYCKKIRDDQNYWHQVETYLCDHTPVNFTHGICPVCYETRVQPQLDALSEHDRKARKKNA
ncbi:MAG: PleD family two-component system response regulator [Gemmataceae bacterium]